MTRYLSKLTGTIQQSDRLQQYTFFSRIAIQGKINNYHKKYQLINLITFLLFQVKIDFSNVF